MEWKERENVKIWRNTEQFKEIKWKIDKSERKLTSSGNS